MHDFNRLMSAMSIDGIWQNNLITLFLRLDRMQLASLVYVSVSMPANWKTGLDSSINSIRLIHIGKHARFHLSVSACVIIVIGDNLGKRLGYGLRDISGD